MSLYQHPSLQLCLCPLLWKVWNVIQFFVWPVQVMKWTIKPTWLDYIESVHVKDLYLSSCSVLVHLQHCACGADPPWWSSPWWGAQMRPRHPGRSPERDPERPVSRPQRYHLPTPQNRKRQLRLITSKSIQMYLSSTISKLYSWHKMLSSTHDTCNVHTPALEAAIKAPFVINGLISWYF